MHLASQFADNRQQRVFPVGGGLPIQVLGGDNHLLLLIATDPRRIDPDQLAKASKLARGS
jgi:hypothetical protein